MESVMPASFVQSVVPVEVDGTWGSIVLLIISALAKLGKQAQINDFQIFFYIQKKIYFKLRPKNAPLSSKASNFYILNDVLKPRLGWPR